MGGSLREGLDTWHAKADGNCAIDYAFHMIMADVNESSLKEMEALVGEGVTSFKLFMAYPGVFYSDDGQILRALQKGAETGGLIMMHAENGIAIDVLVEQALARGHTDPRYHGEVRHAAARGRGDAPGDQARPGRRAPRSTSCTCRRRRRSPRSPRARDEGFNAFAETCPQYLFLSTDDLARPGFEGAKYVCSTPLRPEEHQAALWRGLRTDDLSVVSTDHCPFCFKGQKDMGLGDFSKIPNGLPGVETRMDLLHQGVVEGHISRRRWIEIASATPARMFGLYPRKGTIAPGSDADIVVYDPTRDPGALGVDAPHGRRLLLLRGPRDHRQGPHGPVARPGDRRRRAVPGFGGRRAVPAPRHVPVPEVSAMDIGLVLQTDPPGRRSST